MIFCNRSSKHLHGVGRPVLNAAGDINEYIGTTVDITERKRGEEALRNAQADLTRVARLTTMGGPRHRSPTRSISRSPP